nr:hypothetical protein Itr_chr06CG16800 [Ipomoea trifida]
MGMKDGSLGRRRRYNGTVIHTIAKIGAHLEDIDGRDRKAIEYGGNKIGGAAQRLDNYDFVFDHNIMTIITHDKATTVRGD